MVIGMTYNEFCWKYYADACNIAEIAVSNHVAKYGRLDARIDAEFAKELAISYALEKVYTTYDVDREDDASKGDKKFHNYLYTVVHNQTITELTKQSTQVAGGRGVSFEGMLGTQGEYKVKDYIRYEGRYKHKEETLKELMANVKRLSADDQVIVGYWMEEKRTYVSKCLEEFGMEDSKSSRNVIYIRLSRALDLLGQMMGGKKPDYRDIYVHLPGGSRNGSTPATTEEINLKRQRKRATTAYITRNVDYKSVAERMYKELIG